MLALISVQVTAQTPIRGVRTSQWSSYAAVDSRFFCANKGYKSKDVFASMVNDGVCDCCDGSDEWQTGVCENDCIALGAANRAKAEERARLVAKGYDIATQWAARGEASRVAAQAELDALGQELESKRQELAAIDERKKAAEVVEEKLQEEHRVKKEAEAEAARIIAEAEKAEAEAAAAAAAPAEPSPEGAETSEAASEGATPPPEEQEQEQEQEGADSEAATPSEDYVPEDETAAAVEEEAADGEPSDPDYNEYDPEEDDGEHGDESDDDKEDDKDDKEDDTEDKEDAKEPLPTDPEAEKLRGEHRDTQSVLTKLEDKERELKETLAKDFGSLRQFEPLQHECFDVTQGEWIYSICPYTDSKQKGKHGGGSTDLGRWEGWADGYTAMEFKNGQACWNGPIRSLRVQVRCGGESKLLKVDEPEVCKYVADFETPGACTEEDARLAQLEVESCAADVEE